MGTRTHEACACDPERVVALIEATSVAIRELRPDSLLAFLEKHGFSDPNGELAKASFDCFRIGPLAGDQGVSSRLIDCAIAICRVPDKDGFGIGKGCDETFMARRIVAVPVFDLDSPHPRGEESLLTSSRGTGLTVNAP